MPRGGKEMLNRSHFTFERHHWMQITVVSVAVVDAIAEWEWNVLFFFNVFCVCVFVCAQGEVCVEY